MWTLNVQKRAIRQLTMKFFETYSGLYILTRTCANLLKSLLTLIIAVYFKDRNWIPKTIYCISPLVICKIVFCSKFPDIPDNADRKTRTRRTQAIAKSYVFHANTKTTSWSFLILRWFHFLLICLFEKYGS